MNTQLNKKIIYSTLIVGLLLGLLFWSFNAEAKQNGGIVIGTFLFGICLLYLGLFSGGLLIIFRMLELLKNKSNFFYILFGIYNCGFGLLGYALIIARATDGKFTLFFIISFLLGLLIMLDVCSFNFVKKIIIILFSLSLLPILYWAWSKNEQFKIVQLTNWKIYQPGVIPSDTAKYLEYQKPLNTDSVKYFLSNLKTVWPWEQKFEESKMLSAETKNGKVTNIMISENDEYIETYDNNITLKIPNENLASWHKFIKDHNVFH